jgi:hypothetical protein
MAIDQGGNYLTEQAIEVGGEIKHKELKGQVFENREERYVGVDQVSVCLHRNMQL